MTEENDIMKDAINEARITEVENQQESQSQSMHLFSKGLFDSRRHGQEPETITWGGRIPEVQRDADAGEMGYHPIYIPPADPEDPQDPYPNGRIKLRKNHHAYYWEINSSEAGGEWKTNLIAFGSGVGAKGSEYDDEGDYLYWKLELGGSPWSIVRGDDPMLSDTTQNIRHWIICEIVDGVAIPRHVDDVYETMGG